MDTGPKKIMLGVAIVSLAVGYGLGSLITGEARWQAGMKAGAEKKQAEMSQAIVSSGLLPPDLPIQELNGKVVGVNGNTLTVEVANLNTNPFAASTPTLRTVIVPEEAEIFWLTKKDDDAFAKERVAYLAAEQKFLADLEKGLEALPPTPISPNEQKVISINDVKPGNYVNIVSDSPDVRSANSFNAVYMAVQEANFNGDETIEPIPEQPLPPPPTTTVDAEE